MKNKDNLTEVEYSPFDTPIPGQSLTDEPGNYPWEHPPQYTDVDDVLDRMYDTLTKPTVARQLIAMLDAGVPVEAVVRVITFAGFMEGKFNPDVGFTVIEPLMDLISAIGMETRVSGAGRNAILNVWQTSFNADLVFRLRTGSGSSAEVFRINSGEQCISTGGETAPDVSAGGLCLNQNTSDTAILSFKSTGDVAHGMTSLEQTDTWASFHKDNADAGGVRIRICSGQVKSLKIECFATGENTAEATSALSNFAVDGRPKSGTSVQSHDGDANIASFRTGDAAQVIFKGDGEIFSNQTSTVGTFDEYDDAQLIRSYDLTRG